MDGKQHPETACLVRKVELKKKDFSNNMYKLVRTEAGNLLHFKSETPHLTKLVTLQ